MSLKKQFFDKGKVDDCPIIDMHGHWGPFYGGALTYAGIEETKTHFTAAGVRLLVFSHHNPLMSGDISNQANIDAVKLWPERLRAYLGINPHYPERIERDLASFADNKDYFVGLKLLSDYHSVPLEDDRYKAAWEFADANKLPVLMHTWSGSLFDGFSNLEAVCKRYPNALKMAGHSLHGDTKGAVHLATNYPNMYMELTAVPNIRGAVEAMLEGAGSEKLVYGTDYPWFSEHYYIGSLLGMGFSDDELRNIFYRNAQRILKGFVPDEMISAP